MNLDWSMIGLRFLGLKLVSTKYLFSFFNKQKILSETYNISLQQRKQTYMLKVLIDHGIP